MCISFVWIHTRQDNIYIFTKKQKKFNPCNTFRSSSGQQHFRMRSSVLQSLSSLVIRRERQAMQLHLQVKHDCRLDGSWPKIHHHDGRNGDQAQLWSSTHKAFALSMQQSFTPSDKTSSTQKNPKSLLSRRCHTLKEERAQPVLKVV